MKDQSIEYGAIIELGDHKLICGDATDSELISRYLEKDQIDLILTDPPYGVAYVESKQEFIGSNKDHRKILNDHLQSEAEYETFTHKWMSACKTYLAKKNAYYIFNADPMLFALQRGLTQSGFLFKQLLIWLKTNGVIGRLDYLPQHELVAYGWYGKHAFYKAKDSALLVHPRTQKNTLHPTMKPVPLLRRLILNSSMKGGVVYDPFGGSGSTLMACEQTGRKARLVELSPEYCRVITKRWETFTKQKAKICNPQKA